MTVDDDGSVRAAPNIARLPELCTPHSTRSPASVSESSRVIRGLQARGRASQGRASDW